MIRVVLVDDQELVLTGLRTLLSIEPGIAVVGEAMDGAAGIGLICHQRPDVALIDARMPRRDGIGVIEELSRRAPEVACLLLTTFDEDELVYGALRSGARGHLLKDADPQQLVSAIRRLAVGEIARGSAAAQRLVRDACARRPERVRQVEIERLSSRELEVAALVARGASNREISRLLFVTEGTVKNHVSSALRKLGLRGRTQLAIYLGRSD
jgi:DNA-binding NarL/FixJ family response regulator